MDDRQWAAQWVGWPPHYLMDPSNSDADLAEAVRVKFINGLAKFHSDPKLAGRTAAIDWLYDGPLAFITTVREVVDERD